MEEEPSRIENRVVDNSSMSTRDAKPKEKSSCTTKRSGKKRNVDDDSWIPEGWVKEEIPRPSTGKFPGYIDKKYYAPGVNKAFRSKIEALRYIEKTRLQLLHFYVCTDLKSEETSAANTPET